MVGLRASQAASIFFASGAVFPAFQAAKRGVVGESCLTGITATIEGTGLAARETVEARGVGSIPGGVGASATLTIGVTGLAIFSAGIASAGSQVGCRVLAFGTATILTTFRAAWTT